MPTDCKRIQKRTPATVALQVSSATVAGVRFWILSYRGSTGLKCDAAVHHGIGIYGKLQLTWRPGCNGPCVETRRARDREVLPRQHPITGKGNLLSSSGEETIRRWVGATFSGWDLGGHFATRKSGSVAREWFAANSAREWQQLQSEKV